MKGHVLNFKCDLNENLSRFKATLQFTVTVGDASLLKEKSVF